MTYWHPLLEEWEAQRPDNVSKKMHEQNWSENAKMRKELEALRADLEQYSIALAKIAGVEQ